MLLMHPPPRRYHNEPAPPDSPPVVHSLRAKQPRPEGLRILPKEGRAVIFWWA